MTSTDAAIETLRALTELQCSSGNWDHDPYMHGLANGMILARSLFGEEDTVNYLDAPLVWGKDLPPAPSLPTSSET